MSAAAADGRAAAVAAEYGAQEPTGWFERLYAQAPADGPAAPWDEPVPHPMVERWVSHGDRDGTGKSAIVVGCGLGRDSEFLAANGYRTVAFDVAPTAVRLAGERHPKSTVDYRVADLLALPESWHRSFDLVVESITVQSLPRTLRETAIAGVRSLVAPGGTLLVITGVLTDGADPDEGPPWQLTEAEIDRFAGDAELRVVAIEHLTDERGARCVAEFVRD